MARLTPSSIVETIFRNVHYSVRTLSRTPGLALGVILTLGLGIGASAAVFTAVHAVLIRDLPFPNADRLVSVRQIREGATVANVAPVRLEEWNAQSSTLHALTGYTLEDVSDSTADLPERIRVAGVSPRFFDVWQIAPIAGRVFVDADHQPGVAPVAMISERYWRRRFGADPAVLDTVIGFGPEARQTVQIIGVMPAGFKFPDPNVEVWAASQSLPFIMGRGNSWYTAYGRLEPGVTAEQAQADLRRVQAQLATQFPETDAQLSADVVPLIDTAVGPVRNSLWLLFGAVTVLLLIACMNIASLLLARATERRQEMSIRLALGAPRAAVAGQSLADALLLAVAGAGLGLLVGHGATQALRAVAPNFPRLDEISIGSTTMLYVAALVVAVTILCGLVPAIRNSRASAGSTVEARRNLVASRRSPQWVLVGAQVTLSVALLAAAGLLVRSFQTLSSVDAGFTPANVLTFRITGSFGEPYPQYAEGMERLLAELETVPGVEAAATSSPVPGVASDGTGFQFAPSQWTLVDGANDADTPMVAQNRTVSSSYFETMQIPLLAGGACNRQPQGSMPEAAINQSFATRYLSGVAPVGRQLQGDAGLARVRIAAVVGDARDYGLAREPVPTLYACLTMTSYPPLAILLRTTGDPMAVVNAVRQRIKEVEPARSIYDVAPLEQRIGNEYSADRLRTAIAAIFAGAALLLVAIGLYGTLSYLVSVRKREVGLRVALGAARSEVASLYLMKALRVVGIGCAAGLAVSLALSRFMTSMLYGVSPTDPAILAGVVGTVVLVAAAAAVLPALRAARVDPMQVLRED